jgi:glycosyltransferase involved in cell wall biosynthesis
VELIGQVSDMTPWYRQAWAVCLFSDSEGLPFVVQEAMWAGRPVVTTDLRGVAWFTANAGCVVRDVASAAEALVELCDPEIRRFRGLMARDRARTMLGEDRVYQTLARAYGRGAPAEPVAAADE